MTGQEIYNRIRELGRWIKPEEPDEPDHVIFYIDGTISLYYYDPFRGQFDGIHGIDWDITKENLVILLEKRRIQEEEDRKKAKEAREERERLRDLEDYERLKKKFEKQHEEQGS